MAGKVRIHAAAALAAAALGACAPSSPVQPSPTLGLGVDTAGFDRSVRPQDDFFQFANGGWLARTEIPGDRASTGSFVLLRDQSQAAIRAIIEEAAAGSHPAGSNARKVGDLYGSFMDTVRIEQLGITPLNEELAYIRAIRDRGQLPETFAHLARQGVGTPLGAGVSQDRGNSSRYVVSVSQSGLGLPDRDYYLTQNDRFAAIRQSYTAYAQRMLELAGTPNAAEAARRVVAFETELARVQWERTRNRDANATYNPTALTRLQATTPGFRWADYLRAAGMNGVDTIVVRQPDYFAGMDRVLAATPVQDIQSYLVFKLVDNAAPFLSREFRDTRFAFRGGVLNGIQQQPLRWKSGVDVVEGSLGEAVGELYVQRHFPAESKARMEQLVKNLVEAYREAIDELEWMSPATRAQAQDKLANFTVKIGYPDKWRDYSALAIRPGDLMGNLRRAQEFGYTRMINRLGQPVDRAEWGMTPQTVNAYYNPTNNEIVFPAAILQPPFFDPNADDAVNYGGIGGVIGHEISHGFDDQGRKSDGAGNLRDWWTAADASAFEQRAGMLSQQYGAYEPLEGARVNGQLTLGENIGDLSGLAIAHRAYRRSLNGSQAPVIGGFTGDQRFFLGWAQVWRTKYRDQALRQQLLTDPHSPGMYRTNGVLVNLPAFYEAFNVKPGDRMYVAPEKRVRIW
jgi:predicted metalloendopeptidase